MSCFCFHKWGKVDGDLQYCTTCNIARRVPLNPCNHKWDILDTELIYQGEKYSRFRTLIVGKVITLKCLNCGDIKSERILLNDN